MWSLETVRIFNLRLQTQQLDLTGLFDLILELPAVWKQRRWGMGNIFSVGRDLENKNKRLWNIMATYEKICHDFL
jgi:hypothetical protein